MDFIARFKDTLAKEALIAQNNPFNMNGEQTGELAGLGFANPGVSQLAANVNTSSQPRFMKDKTGGTLSSRNIARDGLEKFHKSAAHPSAHTKDAIASKLALNLNGIGNHGHEHNDNQGTSQPQHSPRFHNNNPDKLHTQSSHKKTVEAVRQQEAEEKRMNMGDVKKFGDKFLRNHGANAFGERAKQPGFSPRGANSMRTPRSQSKEAEIQSIQQLRNGPMPVTKELNVYNE